MNMLLNRLYDFLSRVYFFLQHPSLQKETQYTWNGIQLHLRTGTSDYYVVNEILHHNTYYFDIPKDAVVLDIGANIGVYTLYASQVAKQVIAYEPEASNFARLCLNLRSNPHLKNIFPVQKAVSDKSGKLDLYVVAGNKGMSSTTNHYSNVVQSVDAVGINQVFTENNLESVDIVKIDIEGGEYKIFQSIQSEHLQKVKKITMEFHSVVGESVEDIVTRLEASGFTVDIRRSAADTVAGRGMLYAVNQAG